MHSIAKIRYSFDSFYEIFPVESCINLIRSCLLKPPYYPSADNP